MANSENEREDLEKISEAAENSSDQQPNQESADVDTAADKLDDAVAEDTTDVADTDAATPKDAAAASSESNSDFASDFSFDLGLEDDGFELLPIEREAFLAAAKRNQEDTDPANPETPAAEDTDAASLAANAASDADAAEEVPSEDASDLKAADSAATTAFAATPDAEAADVEPADASDAAPVDAEPADAEPADAALSDDLTEAEAATTVFPEAGDAEADAADVADSEAQTTVLPEASESETEIFDSPDQEPATELLATPAAADAAEPAETKIAPLITRVTDTPVANTSAETQVADAALTEAPQTAEDEEALSKTGGRRGGLALGAAIAVFIIVGLLLVFLTNGNENTEDAAEDTAASESVALPDVLADASAEESAAPASAADVAEETTTTTVDLAEEFPTASAAAPADTGNAAANEEYAAALETAQSLVNVLNMSESELRDALNQPQPGAPTAYSQEAIDYALANVQVDYNAEATDAAAQLANFGMSSDTIRGQLLVKGFTEQQADYAIANIG